MSHSLSSLFIKDFPDCYNVRSLEFSRPVFMDHLSRALPTKNIFDLLGSIRSESLIRMRHYSAEVVFDMLKVIIKWLEVSSKECNRQLEIP